MYHCLKDARFEPPLRLLVDGLPGWQVVWHIAPGGASAYDPAQPVEHLAKLVGALGSIFADQRQIGSHEGPLFVGNVARIRFSSRHAPMLPFTSSYSIERRHR